MPRKPRAPYWQFETTLPSDPKTHRFKEYADEHVKGKWTVDVHRALSIVARFLTGVRVHKPSGDLSDVPPTTIAEWCAWPKDSRVLVAALKHAGFIDPETSAVRGWKKRYGALSIENDEPEEAPEEVPEGNNEGTQEEREGTGKVPEGNAKVPEGNDKGTEKVHTRARGEVDVEVEVKKEHPADKPPVLPVEVKAPKKKRKTPGDLIDPATIDPDLARLWFAHVESTGRKAGGGYVLTARRVTILGELLAWAGGKIDAAERGVRAVGASAWHRENDKDALEDKPFRTREAFAKYVGGDRDPSARVACSLTWGSSPPPPPEPPTPPEPLSVRIAKEEAAVKEAKDWLAAAKGVGERNNAAAALSHHEFALRDLLRERATA